MPIDGAGSARMIEKYRNLISDFVSGRTSAQHFESAYLRMFKSDKDQVPGREFNILEKLFLAVDDYVSDPELRQKTSGLSGDELRASAKEAYARLYQI